MGDLVWHEWGRLMALASATYMVWASSWAMFFRKFFWDMVGGTVGPKGIIPGANAKPFLAIIVNIPLLQIFTLLIGLSTIALEWPLPLIKGGPLHRSIHFRVVLYFLAGFIGIMIYQTVDCSVYYVLTSAVYGRALARGEEIGTEGRKEKTDA